MIVHLVTSFIATAAFAILFNAPKKSLIRCGFVGMAGWFIFRLLVDYQFDAVVASFVGAFIVAVISQICSKIYKTPVTIFSISGIIPLVPGGSAYDAMRHFVFNDYNTAVQLAAKAFMISGAIAVGLVISEVLNQLVVKIKFR
ncbi:threonine/serine exporter [Cytobacillus depressus]|uniref:Threonine/serine exporter n=1 Tax=Cytobacillus depressus TaxID=1602942 RepID=A0A6L3VBE3_9BACI|nr:threonine/serine exporter family protein [Cytobacillus depressus]KAB2338097.1 threonine/serine exporter [Cytobacillus depressus]